MMLALISLDVLAKDVVIDILLLGTILLNISYCMIWIKIIKTLCGDIMVSKTLESKMLQLEKKKQEMRWLVCMIFLMMYLSNH